MRALVVVVALVVSSLPAAAQYSLWTIDDLRAGRIEERHGVPFRAAPGQTEQQAVDFANRFRPKPQPVSQVLSSAPEACAPGFVRAYPDMPCVEEAPEPEPPATLTAGRCYRGHYASLQFIVLRVEQGVASFAWIPHPGNATTGAGTFPLEQPILSNLRETACPWRAQ